MNAHVIRQAGQVARCTLDITDQEEQARQAVARDTPRGKRERVGGRIEPDGERVGPRARNEEREAPVSRPDIDDRPGERAG